MQAALAMWTQVRIYRLHSVATHKLGIFAWCDFIMLDFVASNTSVAAPPASEDKSCLCMQWWDLPQALACHTSL